VNQVRTQAHPRKTAPQTDGPDDRLADAEPPDAEPPDAEPPDAEPPDAEPPDAEPPDAEAVPEPDDPEPAGPQPSAAEAGGRHIAALVLAVVCVLCAAWFGWSWYGAAHDESLGYSQTRDEVLRAGEQAVQNLNTLDYRNLNEGLKLWQDSSTSELYQEIVQGRAQFERAVRTAKTITSAAVLDAAVTELDQHGGKASVIVGLRVTVTPPTGEPTVKKTRLMGELTRTAAGWKLSALAQAPVGATG
jgi:Mce-associated membrane protein